MVKIKRVSDIDFGYANIIVFGESGTGKTHFAGTYNHEKVLIINVKTESGLMTLRAQGIDMDVLEVDSYLDMKEAIEWIKKNGAKYDVLFVDSLSQWQKKLNIDLPDNGDTRKKWGIIKEYTYEIVHAITALPFHVIFTCELKKEKDGETGSFSYLPSLYGSSREDIPYWFDELYYFTRFQVKIGDPIEYKMLTAAAIKYPCKSRLGADINIDNPQLSSILKMPIFKQIDKATQTKELFEVAEKEEIASETNVDRMRGLLATKDVDVVKFLAHYNANNIPSFPDDKVADAIEKLNKCKNKKVEIK